MTDVSPARPQLGHNVLAAAESFATSNPARFASTGCARIDEEVLEGGFRYGEIASIAGAIGTGKTLLTYHAAVSHLIAPKSPHVTTDTSDVVIIDTNGSFSPVRLRDVFFYRLRARAQREAVLRQSGYVYQQAESHHRLSEDGLMAEATKLLDRVRVMRVFDLAGVAEAVGEVSEVMDRARTRRVGGPQQKLVPRSRNRSGEVEDSEEELDEQDEERSVEATGSADATTACTSKSEAPVGMVIIDTLANVVSSIITQNQTHGQALLVSLMRSLRYLTARYTLCTILTNAVVGANTRSSMNPDHRYPGPPVNASLFASTLGRPALGKTFSHLISASFFLSSVPKMKDDAMVAFGQTGERRWRNAHVIEMLKDHFGGREGRWLGFEIADGVKLVPVNLSV